MGIRSTTPQAYSMKEKSTTPVSAAHELVKRTQQSMGPPPKSQPRPRQRSDSMTSVQSFIVGASVDNRITWPTTPQVVAPGPPLTSHRSPYSSSRNPSQTNLHQPSNSPVIPAHIQRTTSNQHTSAPPTLARRNSKSSSRPYRILFYNKNEPYYGFTNFSNHGVKVDGKVYPTSEHLFQSMKFAHRPLLAEHIRTCDDRPSVAFSEARRFQPEVREDWGVCSIRAMEFALWHKFNQHKSLKEELLSTGDAELVENSHKDSFWGCGPDGKGRNELGKALVRLRSKLRA